MNTYLTNQLELKSELLKLKSNIIKSQQEKINLMKSNLPKDEKNFWNLILEIENLNHPIWEGMSLSSKALTFDFNKSQPTQSVLDFNVFFLMEACKYFQPTPKELLNIPVNIKIIVHDDSFYINLDRWNYFISRSDEFNCLLNSEAVLKALDRLKIILEKEVLDHFLVKKIDIKEFILFCQKHNFN